MAFRLTPNMTMKCTVCGHEVAVDRNANKPCLRCAGVPNRPGPFPKEKRPPQFKKTR